MYPIVPLIALAFPGAASRHVELLSEARYGTVGEVNCLTTDGDTAYICEGSAVRKVVYDNGAIRTIDSVPSRLGAAGNRWNDAEYVSIGSGRGILAVVNFPVSDTAAWLIDWMRTGREVGPSNTSKWVSYMPAPGGVGFSWDCPLVGRTLAGMDAVFGTDKGLFQLTLVNGSAGYGIGIRASIGTSASSTWTSWALDSTRVVGASAVRKRLESWKGSMYYDVLSSYSFTDSMVLDTSTTSPWVGATSVLSSRGGGTLLFSNDGDKGLSIRNGKVDTFDLPCLLSRQFGAQYRANVYGARSRNGLVAAAGDSMLAMLDWNGSDKPSIAFQTELLLHTTKAIAFGDSILWLAEKGIVRAWRIAISTAPVSVIEAARSSAWKATGSARSIRLEGTFLADEVEILDPSGRRLGRARVQQGGATEIPIDVSGLLFVRCGSEVRRVFAGH